MLSRSPTANKVHYILSWIPFISFSSLIALTKTYSTMLNNSVESGHPYLVPDLIGNAFSFYTLSIMLVVGLSYMVSIILTYITLNTRWKD